jgi:hypothetical protein
LFCSAGVPPADLRFQLREKKQPAGRWRYKNLQSIREPAASSESRITFELSFTRQNETCHSKKVNNIYPKK